MANNLSLKSNNPPLHSLHRSIVSIYVSPDKYPFYFHKGRLCQHSKFFESAFHGSFNEATTGSMYLEEEGVKEFKLFEEWIYSEQLIYPEDSDDPSLLLVKLFCFAHIVGIPKLQNDTLDALRERATGRVVSLESPSTTHNNENHQNPFSSATGSIFHFEKRETGTSLAAEKSPTHYLFPATSNAVQHAYQKTPEGSSLRKLLADMFAYNVKPETLGEDILLFPVEFIIDVLLINMKRFPLRLKAEKADFDLDAERYHVPDSLDTDHDRKQEAFKNLGAKGTELDIDLNNATSVEVTESIWRRLGGPSKSPNGKAKKKGSKKSA